MFGSRDDCGIVCFTVIAFSFYAIDTSDAIDTNLAIPWHKCFCQTIPMMRQLRQSRQSVSVSARKRNPRHIRTGGVPRRMAVNDRSFRRIPKVLWANGGSPFSLHQVV